MTHFARNTLLKLTVCAACFGAVLSGCSSQPYNNYSDSGYGNQVEYGRVTAIDVVRGGQSTGAGAVVGGIIGGVLGHQVGKGRGRDAATVAGAVGGAVVGNEVEKGGRTVFRIEVRVDGGGIRTFERTDAGDLRVGDRVRLAGSSISRYY